jgi:predicted SprT family Zn-dependent metalloprotease
MLYIWDIEKIIKHTLKELRLNINVEFSDKVTEPMIYNASTNTIKFNYIQINGYNAKLNFKIRETDENFVKIILYHELGYYLEFRKNPRVLKTLIYGKEEEKKQFLEEIEENAWELGRTLVPENLLKAYDQVRELDKLLLKV